jgi:hypothetical protein
MGELSVVCLQGRLWSATCSLYRCLSNMSYYIASTNYLSAFSWSGRWMPETWMPEMVVFSIQLVGSNNDV